MKKTYEAPALIVSGNVVEMTKASNIGPGEGTRLSESAGSVGFGL